MPDIPAGLRYSTDHLWEPGADPERRDYASIADFADPDGNTWVLQEFRDRPATHGD